MATINLSDDTLDHLRFHLGAQADVLTVKLAKAGALKSASDPRKIGSARVTALRARLAEVRDLLAIFDETAEPAPVADVVATNQGSVFHFALATDAAVDVAKENFAIESWQWLGDRAFAVDHRFAPQVVCVLRDNGFNVVVR